MVKTSCSFRPLPLCISSYRHMKFRYCWWKKSCTTFRDPQLKPRAPNLTLFEDTVIKMDLCEWRKSCTTCQHVIQHWAWGYGGATYALANVWLWRWCRISSIHRRKKRISCIFGLAKFFPPPATSTGSNPSLVRMASCHNSSLVCSSYALNWARGKMRYMAEAARYTANYTQHLATFTSLKRILLPLSSWFGSHFPKCQRFFAQLVLQYDQT